MTAVVAMALLALAALDGTFAGFRSSIGRTGLIDHRRADRVAARRGLTLVLVLLAPVVVLVSADVLRRPDRLVGYTEIGAAMLTVYLPYAAVVLLALAVYAVLGWRLKYLATAVILGPFTLIRPAVAGLGGVLGLTGVHDLLAAVATVSAVAAVLAVEPLVDRWWYGRRVRPVQPAGGP